MPTTRASSTSTTSVTSLAETLKHQLDASTSTTIYVPLDGGDAPSDAELKALTAEGLHVEHDVVRDALAVRKATDDEVAEAEAASETSHSATPAPAHAASSTTA